MLLPAAAYESSTDQEQPAWDGYIVKLNDDVPWIQTMSMDTAYEQAGHFLVVDTLEQARQLPEDYVAYVEPNYYVELLVEEDDTASNTESDDGVRLETAPFVPNDTYYADYQWNLREIKAMTAYRQGLMGEGVRIGFVDSGINLGHEDLNSSLIDGENFNADGLNYYEDTYSHGTFAAGIVAAQTNNALGLAGIAPNAEIMAYRVFSQKTTTMSAVVAAIDAAIADECDIINLSLGTTGQSLTLQQAVDRAAQAGIIVVAAVGNDGKSTLHYPAAYSTVIGVGSVDTGLTVSDFSQRNSSVFVTAPGGGVVSLDNADTAGYRLNMASASNRGTSFAAPVVTGMAALALGYDGDITEEGVRYLLQTTSVDKDTAGYDTKYGYGVVDVEAFLAELQREFTVQYVLNGGTLPEEAVQTYNVKDASLSLPTPTWEGHQFAGWYTASDLSGLPATQIEAGSLGDKTYFAAWQADRTVGVKAVTANGYIAAKQEDGSYRVQVPFGTDRSKLVVQVTPAEEGSSITIPTSSDDGATWTFTVTNGQRSTDYTLYVCYSEEAGAFPIGSELAVENFHSGGLVGSIATSGITDGTIDIRATLRQDTEGAVMYLAVYHSGGRLKNLYWSPFSGRSATLTVPYSQFSDDYTLSILGPNMQPLIVPISSPNDGLPAE